LNITFCSYAVQHSAQIVLAAPPAKLIVEGVFRRRTTVSSNHSGACPNDPPRLQDKASSYHLALAVITFPSGFRAYHRPLFPVNIPASPWTDKPHLPYRQDRIVHIESPLVTVADNGKSDAISTFPDSPVASAANVKIHAITARKMLGSMLLHLALQDRRSALVKAMVREMCAPLPGWKEVWRNFPASTVLRQRSLHL
jgi:hypothetical protein